MKMRIGVLNVQNRSGAQVPTTGLNERLARALRRAGFETVQMEFGPPADVDKKARAAKCDFLLYTDIADVRRTGTAGRVVKKATGAKQTNKTFAADIEFRLFSLDEMIPAVSTQVTGKTQEANKEKEPVVSVTVKYDSLDNSVDSIFMASPNLPILTTNDAKMAALKAAFERTAKTVRVAMEGSQKAAPAR